MRTTYPNALPRKVAIAACALLAVVLIGCSGGRQERVELLVFAATSLQDVLPEVEQAFEAEHEITVDFSYGASQMLAQQIANGAPADLFIAAGQLPVDFLKERAMVGPEVIGILSNSLVVVSRRGLQLASLQDLDTGAVERIAIASPELSPAGHYARDSLVRLGLWDRLRSKLVFGDDVRSVLVYVKAGNADAAIVYRTDSRLAGDLNVFDIIPPGSYTPVTYPAAVLRSSGKQLQAGQFLDFLRSDEARAIFLRYGFTPLNQ